MLQANEIQQRYSHLQQTIGEAEQACKSSQRHAAGDARLYRAHCTGGETGARCDAVER